MSDDSRMLEVVRLGRRPYADVYALQQEILAKRIDDEVPDTLVLTEHDDVITLGRGTDPNSVRDVPYPIHEIERGGDATYHGPGQVVAYPIFKLPDGRRDLHRYLRDLEEVVLGVLREFEIEGRREPGKTGVWIGDKKVCSIGVAVRRWVTWHGLALNVHTDLDAFTSFKPCGLDASVMTTVAAHAELPPANILFEVLLIKHFVQVFELELPEPPPQQPESGFPELPILPS